MTTPAWHWVDKQALLLLHDESLATHGGASGVRDEGLLDSARARPLNLVAYGTPDVAELAGACLMHTLLASMPPSRTLRSGRLRLKHGPRTWRGQGAAPNSVRSS